MEQTDVIVIGAGAIGCSAAWHLRQAGAAVTVVEAAAKPAAQSTGAAAGFVASWSALHVPAWGATEWAMQQYGLQFYRQLAASQSPADWLATNGIAYIYLDPAQWAAAQARIEALREFGTPVEILDRAASHRLLPLIAYDAVAGIAYDPSALRVRASEAIGCLARAAERDGVRFAYDTRVEALLAVNGTITGVMTNDGPLSSRAVVVAAGAWSRPLLTRLGVRCVAEPLVETRYLTAPLAGISAHLPLLIFSDCHGFYIREERGGLLIGGADNPPLPSDRYVDPDAPPTVAGLPPDQAYRMRHYLRKLEYAMPVLKAAEIVTINSGLPTFSPDLRFIVDAVPGYAGLTVATACQEAGVTHGPAIGRMLADLVTGRPSHWDRERFHFTSASTQQELH
jgi:glycine/D-amino acid oxidase-like deaminating enzyme